MLKTLITTCYFCRERKTCYLGLPKPCCEQCARRMDVMSDEEFEKAKKRLIAELRHYPSMEKLDEVLRMLTERGDMR